MINQYLESLGEIVGRVDEYGLLLHELYNMEYYSLIPNDDNRGEDGKVLRQKFWSEVGPTGAPSLPGGACRVLEMLIGLSFRLEFELANSRWEKTPGEWFWILIDNLGLSWCTNDEYLGGAGNGDVRDIVTRMLERKYEGNGNGGLFPLKCPKKDQRTVEIWYQMSAYVCENYPVSLF